MSKFKSFDRFQTGASDTFVIGDRSDEFASIKHLHPRFAFDFISLSGSGFCFNSTDLGYRDYHKLLKAFKDLSSQTYEVMNREYRYHFHDIDWDDVTVAKSDFLKCIYKDIRKDDYDEDDITAYQFKVY